jgi:hypothetical protein
MRLAFVLGWALAATAAAAQGSPPPKRAPAATAPRVQVAPATVGRGPAPDRLEAAADSVARIKQAVKLVLGRAEQARNEKDVVKLNCVNEKLTQMKALQKVAEQADGALRDLSATKASGGDAEFSKVAIARTKVEGLRRDAEQCVGQLAYLIDEKTTIDMEQPSNLPGGADGGLGVARRGENPADSVDDIGGPPSDPPPCPGNAPFCPPPVVRPPPASMFR